MNLLKWFICWVTDNRSTFSLQELEELNFLIERIQIELRDSSDSEDCSIRSEEHLQQRNLDTSKSLHDEKISSRDSLVGEVDEIERNLFSFGAQDIFLSLVKIYLKDARQINLSYQSVSSKTSVLAEEFRLDNDLNDEENLVCGNEETDNIQSNFNSSLLAVEKKIGEEMKCSTETRSSSIQTNCSSSSVVSPASGRTISSKTVESCKKLRHIRQDLKKLSHNLLKLDENTSRPTDIDAITRLNEALRGHRFELGSMKFESNERSSATCEALIEHTERLVARLNTATPPSSSESNEQSADCEKPKTSPSDRVEQVRNLAERVDRDMKLSLFDSFTDKDWLNFDEKLTNCLIQLDCVACADDESLLAARKKGVEYVEEVICRLQIKGALDRFLTNNIEDPSRSVSPDETEQRIRQVESLAERIEYFSGVCGSQADDYFSIDSLLAKCLVQLSYVDCLDDEQLTKRRRRVVDYVNRLALATHSADASSLAPEPCDERVARYSATATDAFESIKKAQMESERLNVHIEFGSFRARTDRIYVYIEEMLTKLLITLDSVSCDGNGQVRAARKKAVRYINQLTDKLEAKVAS